MEVTHTTRDSTSEVAARFVASVRQGSAMMNFVNAAGATLMTRSIKEDIDIGLIRVNYKFGPNFMSGMGMGMGR